MTLPGLSVLKANAEAITLGIVLAVILAVCIWIYNSGKHSQAPKVAAAQAEAQVATARATVAEAQVDNSSTLARSSLDANQKAASHADAIRQAPDGDAAFAEYLRGLHDAKIVPVGPVSAGPKPPHPSPASH